MCVCVCVCVHMSVCLCVCVSVCVCVWQVLYLNRVVDMTKDNQLGCKDAVITILVPANHHILVHSVQYTVHYATQQ